MYQDLDDIVFEERHKGYGAYAFRKHYEFTLTKALVVGIFLFSVLFFIPASFIKSPAQKAVDSEKIIPVELTDMKIDFGDRAEGFGKEEPKPEEGSPAPLEEKKEEIVAENKKEKSKEISDKNIQENVVPIPTREKSSPTTAKKNDNKEKSKSSITKEVKTSAKENITKTTGDIRKENGKGDGQGNAAIGNLLKGRGSKSGSQGNTQGIGNYGDPLGADSDGNSIIGVDRKLIGFIPGTMGRGGTQPHHDCTASGTIVIGYTVDKSGKVTSAKRQSGISDVCVVSTAVGWVKQYVKAEPASISSKGTYRIVF